jgi:MFS family permease
MEKVLQPNWKSVAPVEKKPSAARRAVSALFFLNGALFATWVSRIPAVKLQHGLSNGALGLALLAVALGAVVAMPFAGWLTARVGSGKVSKIAAVLYCVMLPGPVLAPNLALFALSLFFFGGFHGALDVAMNAQAVAVEKRYRAPIMSSFHALFSAGGLTGAVLGGLLAAQGLTPLTHFILVASVFTGIILIALPHLLDARSQEVFVASTEKMKRTFPWPTRGLLALGAVALCIMMGEGAMADWTAVYLRNNLATSESLTAAGYAAFSIAMAVGRLFGDRLTARLGPVSLGRGGSVLAATGLLIALCFTTPIGALIGFACVGLGFATIVPIVFSAAGRAEGIAPGVALASVTTMGYLGFLVGPPFIGLAAELVGLRFALGIIILTSLISAALSGFLQPKRVRPTKESRVVINYPATESMVLGK